MILRKTDDGSPTLYRPDIDEHYHSTRGALAESRHVYIESGLLHRASQLPACNPVRIFEVGFGTGLNAALAAMTGIAVEYHTIEKFPLDMATVNLLDFGQEVDNELLAAIHSAPWDTVCGINGTFTLKKILGDLTAYKPEAVFDVVFMDAFAPEKQPEMWSDEILTLLSSMLAPGGVLTTYCAKGRIRRAFNERGLLTERLPGPPGGKREILRATKPYCMKTD